jgi:hypothetical protein
LNSLEKLTVLMQQAVERAQGDTSQTIASALAEAVPEIIRALVGIIVAPETSQTVKMKSVEILLGLWTKSTRADIAHHHQEAKKAKAQAAKATATAKAVELKVIEKKVDLKRHKEQAKIARQLRAATRG